MKHRVKVALFLLLIAAAAAPRLFARERSAFLQDVEFQGRTYSLDAVFRPGQADLRLRGKGEKNLSAGMPGENLLLGVRSGSSSFYIFWLNYRHKALRLAYYDSRSDSSRLLPLRDFTAIGLPQISETGGRLRALIFLANRSGNDDIFYYELAARTLTQVTHTPFSEKMFSVDEKDGQLEIGTLSLWAEFRYRFVPQLRQSVLLTENRLRSRLKSEPMAESTALDRDYCNTYIGFGDSITEGQIEGVVRPELCFLTQMRDIYLPPVYGAAIPVNLGVGGTSTSGGAERVNNDLDENPGFYFLLFYGVNDVYKADFSLASSLENIEFMIDAALARGMRVIVTTLTPRKDHIALYQYYWDHLYAFSAAILDLAGEKGVAAIDTLDAFMKTDPPNGWKTLLEAIITGVSKGNHPNEAGHSVIAGLFANALAQFPPLAPTGVTVVDPLNKLSRTASWNINQESDFSHFRVEFGLQPQALPYALDTPACYCTFNLFPFLPRVYFHVQTVDKGGRRSAFSTINGASPAASPAQKNKK